MTVLALASLGATRARAQLDPELMGGGRASSGSPTWGEDAGPVEPDDPLRIVGFLGAGIGFRLVRNVDPEFQQDFLAPGYLDLGAAVFFPGAALRHGVGLAVTSNLTPDVSGATYASPIFGQWVLTPSYHLLMPLRRFIPDLQHDWLHVQVRVGVPVVFSTGASDGALITVGAEAAGALHFKFLAGLGLYVEANAAIYAGPDFVTFHPVVGVDGGFIIDYEVLP